MHKPQSFSISALRRFVILLLGLCSWLILPAQAQVGRFNLNADNTVTDSSTGLIWDRCAKGLTGSDCTGGAALWPDWPTAMTEAKAANDGLGYNGHKDWRLPDLKELESLIDLSRINPAIDGTEFPLTSSWFWSSTQYAGDSSLAWLVNFYDGFSNYGNKVLTRQVRLVRGGQSFAPFDLLAPTVSSISPASGSTAGGTSVTITGTNLDNSATGVTIGSNACTGLSVNSATSVTCNTPAGTAGTASVVVTTTIGSNAANTLFTYVTPTPAPAVSSISPTSGTTAGGTSVTITGTDLGSATGVTIGGSACTTLSANTATSVTCNTPAGTAGTASVLVTTAGGTNAANTLFTYVTPTPYTKIANNGNDLPDTATLGIGATDWACTRDNATGLVWEVKTNDATPGLRDMTKGYTNYDDTAQAQKSNGSGGYINPTQAEIDADTNSIGFANRVNDTALCGSVQWRRPSQSELHGIVKTGSDPTIDSTFFPNTPASSNFWSGSPDTVSYGALAVYFLNGYNANYSRSNYESVRLVRGGPSFASYTLTITGSGSGSVTTGNINCTIASGATSGTCAEGRGINSVVTLTATPASGNIFTGWSGDCSGTSTPCSVTMSTSRSVTAGFSLAYSVTYDGNGKTGGAAPTDGSSPYSSGATVTVLGNTGNLVKTGYTFAGWNTLATGLGTDYAASFTITANTTLFAKWTLIPSPTVSGINPTSGSTAGGTSVTITGTNLTGASVVLIGDYPCTTVNVVLATSITCITPVGITPAGSPGNAYVTVITAGGSNTPGTFFTYVTPAPPPSVPAPDPAPSVTSIIPASGSTVGGTVITLSGNWFSNGASVSIGGAPASSVVVTNSTSLTALTPAGVAGARDVVVTNPDGQRGTLVNGFSYLPSPTVSAISAGSGMTEGGISVTLTGTNLGSATGVTIGGNACAPVSVNTDTTITCTTPAGNAGPARVQVTTANGTSTDNTLFIYVQNGPLNDTGQSLCTKDSNTTAVWETCTAANSGSASSIPGQDGRYGRDAAFAAGQLTKIGGGSGGFDFTRICFNGAAEGTTSGQNTCTGTLVANTTAAASATPATDWACTKDNVTNLVWSLQTQSATWDAASASTYADAGHNGISRCGGTGWRLPTLRELLSIVAFDRINPSIDVGWFPEKVSSLYWTSELSVSKTVFVNFDDGHFASSNILSTGSVRLVRSGQ